jgi:hypothetical protein
MCADKWARRAAPPMIPDFAVEFDGEREVEPFRNEADGLVPLSRQ